MVSVTGYALRNAAWGVEAQTHQSFFVIPQHMIDKALTSVSIFVRVATGVLAYR